MLEPYDGKLSRTVLRREGGGNTADPADYSPLVNRLKGQVIKISPNSTQFINPMDINANYSEEDKDRIWLSGCGRADCAGGRRRFLCLCEAEAEKAGRKRSP